MLKGFEQRVVDEKDYIDRKARSLQTFMMGDKMKGLPQDEQARLANQYIAMKNYSTILGDRIQAFSAEPIKNA